jgi:hypothetical protein
MTARNKPPLRIETGPSAGFASQNRTDIVRVHVSYRALSRGWAFRPNWVPAAEVAAARAALSQQVEALPDAELRREAAEWTQQAQQERAAKQEQAAQQARSSPSMGP